MRLTFSCQEGPSRPRGVFRASLEIFDMDYRSMWPPPRASTGVTFAQNRETCHDIASKEKRLLYACRASKLRQERNNLILNVRPRDAKHFARRWETDLSRASWKIMQKSKDFAINVKSPRRRNTRVTSLEMFFCRWSYASDDAWTVIYELKSLSIQPSEFAITTMSFPIKLRTNERSNKLISSALDVHNWQTCRAYTIAK